MKKIPIHILLIIIFLAIPILSSPDLDRSFSMLRVPMFQKNFLQMVLLIIFLYLNYLFLMPRFFSKKKYFLFGVLVFFCFLCINFIPTFLVDLLGNHLPPKESKYMTLKPPKDFPDNNFGLQLFRGFFSFSFTFLCSFLFINPMNIEN